MANNLIQQATAQPVPQEEKDARQVLQQYIRQMSGEIRRALPAVLTPERFTRIVQSAISTNPKLAMTTPQSFLAAMMTAAQLGVEPNTPLGQAYLIPYWNKKIGRSECQFQLGYKGLIDLAYRSGDVILIQAQVVYEGDSFNYAFGLNPELKHVPARGERGEPAYVYALFRTKDGGFGFEVDSIEAIRIFARRYSQAYETGPWKTNFEEMAKKTVLKRVLKYAPLKTEFQRGIAQDESVKTEIGEDMYAIPGMFPEVEPVSAEEEENRHDERQ